MSYSRSAREGWATSSVVTLLAVTGGLAAASLLSTRMPVQGNGSPPSAPQHAASVDYANQLSIAFRSAAERALPSVVLIQASPDLTHQSPQGRNGQSGKQFDFGNSPFDELFRNHPELRRFFKQFQSPQRPEPTVASGSGVIIDSSGWILTNEHVVQGSGKILVQLQDGREFQASNVHGDPTSDLAILRIHADQPLPAAQLGDSSQIQVGDWVLALGEPFGLQGTVTAGIISATGRSVGISRPMPPSIPVTAVVLWSTSTVR